LSNSLGGGGGKSELPLLGPDGGIGVCLGSSPKFQPFNGDDESTSARQNAKLIANKRMKDIHDGC
jgi:hypothetical protein